MSTSISRQIVLGGTAVLGATLVLVGVATAMVLHRRQVSALDEALLIAAHGRAHPEVEVEVEVEHSRAPIESWSSRLDPMARGKSRMRSAAIACRSASISCRGKAISRAPST